MRHHGGLPYDFFRTDIDVFTDYIYNDMVPIASLSDHIFLQGDLIFCEDHFGDGVIGKVVESLGVYGILQITEFDGFYNTEFGDTFNNSQDYESVVEHFTTRIVAIVDQGVGRPKGKRV